MVAIDPSTRRRILITGGSGFVGRHAAVNLAGLGHEVTVASRRPHGMQGVSCVHIDLLRDDPGAMLARAAPDTLIHMAWTTEHGRFWSSPANLDWLAATVRLARLFREGGGFRFVGVGTCFEYDIEQAPEAGFTETMEPKPRLLYAVAKDAARRAIEAYAEISGLSFAWARLFHQYGPDECEDRLAPSIAKAIRAGEPARCTKGRQRRDFMHAADAGRAIAMAALSDLKGPLNIASGEATTVAKVAQTIGRLLGRPDLVALGALPERAGDPPVLLADVTRLKGIGFTPAFSLEKGLSDVFGHAHEL